MRHRAIADNRKPSVNSAAFLLKSQKIPRMTGYADSDFTCKTLWISKPAGRPAKYPAPELLDRWCRSLMLQQARQLAPQISRADGN